MSSVDLNSKIQELFENDDTENFYSLISELIEENKEYESDLEQNLNLLFEILSNDMNDSNHEKKMSFICLFFEILISENLDICLYLEKLFSLIKETNLYSDESIKRIINICSNATLNKKNLFKSLIKLAKNKVEYLYIIFSLAGFKDIIIDTLSENWDIIFELLNNQNIKSNSVDIKNVLKCLELLINLSEEKFQPYASSALYQALDYLSETDIELQKRSLMIIYNLTKFCDAQVQSVSDNIVEFLKVLQKGKNIEINNLCNTLLKHFTGEQEEGEGDEEGERGDEEIEENNIDIEHENENIIDNDNYNENVGENERNNEDNYEAENKYKKYDYNYGKKSNINNEENNCEKENFEEVENNDIKNLREKNIYSNDKINSYKNNTNNKNININKEEEYENQNDNEEQDYNEYNYSKNKNKNTINSRPIKNDNKNNNNTSNIYENIDIDAIMKKIKDLSNKQIIILNSIEQYKTDTERIINQKKNKIKSLEEKIQDLEEKIRIEKNKRRKRESNAGKDSWKTNYQMKRKMNNNNSKNKYEDENDDYNDDYYGYNK